LIYSVAVRRALRSRFGATPRLSRDGLSRDRLSRDGLLCGRRRHHQPRAEHHSQIQRHNRNGNSDDDHREPGGQRSQHGGAVPVVVIVIIRSIAPGDSILFFVRSWGRPRASRSVVVAETIEIRAIVLIDQIAGAWRQLLFGGQRPGRRVDVNQVVLEIVLGAQCRPVVRQVFETQ
jgi:hypothetical protein